MPRRKKGEAPQMRLHKPSGRAYVHVAGAMTYLGKWGSAEAKRVYLDFIRHWSRENPKPAAELAFNPTVADLVMTFQDYAATHYVRRDGSQTDEVRHTRNALSPLIERHAARRADDIMGRDLRGIVEAWRTEGQTRKYINKNLGRIKRAFRWAAEREYVSESTAARLAMVRGVSIGQAPDNPEIQPVDLRDLARTLRHLRDTKPMFEAMARLGYYCGARPGEICRMRGDEVFVGSFRVDGKVIKIPEGLAVFCPSQHKTAKRGQTVYYTLGPRAQEVLAKWNTSASFLFKLAGHGARRESVAEGHYSKTIGEAAEAAGAARWTPNQLRHNFATRWEVVAGVEAASAALRHRHLSTTAVYVQRDLTRVGELAARLG